MPRYDQYDPWEHAEDLGLTLLYGPRSRIDHDAELYLDEGFVILRPGMTWRKERCTLTHENEHAIRGDRPIADGVELRKRELRVDRLAAERLIDPAKLKRAMLEYSDPGDWCLELNVTARLMRVYLNQHPEVRLEAELLDGLHSGERPEVMC